MAIYKLISCLAPLSPASSRSMEAPLVSSPQSRWTNVSRLSKLGQLFKSVEGELQGQLLGLQSLLIRLRSSLSGTAISQRETSTIKLPGDLTLQGPTNTVIGISTLLESIYQAFVSLSKEVTSLGKEHDKFFTAVATSAGHMSDVILQLNTQIVRISEALEGNREEHFMEALAQDDAADALEHILAGTDQTEGKLCAASEHALNIITVSGPTIAHVKRETLQALLTKLIQLRDQGTDQIKLLQQENAALTAENQSLKQTQSSNDGELRLLVAHLEKTNSTLTTQLQQANDALTATRQELTSRTDEFKDRSTRSGLAILTLTAELQEARMMCETQRLRAAAAEAKQSRKPDSDSGCSIM